MPKPRFIDPNAHKALSRVTQTVPMAQARIKLKKWMDERQLTVSAFAMTVCMDRKVLQHHINGVLHNKTYMALHQAFAIEWATQGHVQAWEWLDDPYQAAKIRHGNMMHVKDFENRIKSYVLKYNSLKTNEGMLREKARVLSRLFNVQWGEVKTRAWRDAENRAMAERADISHLLAPEDNGPTDDGVYYPTPEFNERHKELSNEEWFKKATQG